MGRYITVIVALGIAGGVFFYFTKPAYDRVKGLQSQATQYDAALEKASELQAKKVELTTKRNNFTSDQLSHIQKMLPDHVDNVALILDLDNLAARYAMPIQNVDVSTPASNASTPGVISAVGASGQKYDSVTIRFSTTASYDDFKLFLRDLEQSLRIVDLISLSLTQGEVAGPGGKQMFTYSVSLRTYWLK
jgi:Tfp pilus assembly protein PilO